MPPLPRERQPLRGRPPDRARARARGAAGAPLHVPPALGSRARSVRSAGSRGTATPSSVSATVSSSRASAIPVRSPTSEAAAVTPRSTRWSRTSFERIPGAACSTGSRTAATSGSSARRDSTCRSAPSPAPRRPVPGVPLVRRRSRLRAARASRRKLRRRSSTSSTSSSRTAPTRTSVHMASHNSAGAASTAGSAEARARRWPSSWVLSMSDGTNSLLEIAERSGIGFARHSVAADRLEAHGLLETSDMTARARGPSAPDPGRRERRDGGARS